MANITAYPVKVTGPTYRLATQGTHGNVACASFVLPKNVKYPELGFNIVMPMKGFLKGGSQLTFLTKQDADDFNIKYGLGCYSYESRDVDSEFIRVGDTNIYLQCKTPWGTSVRFDPQKAPAGLINNLNKNVNAVYNPNASKDTLAKKQQSEDIISKTEEDTKNYLLSALPGTWTETNSTNKRYKDWKTVLPISNKVSLDLQLGWDYDPLNLASKSYKYGLSGKVVIDIKDIAKKYDQVSDEFLEALSHGIWDCELKNICKEADDIITNIGEDWRDTSIRVSSGDNFTKSDILLRNEQITYIFNYGYRYLERKLSKIDERNIEKLKEIAKIFNELIEAYKIACKSIYDWVLDSVEFVDLFE